MQLVVPEILADVRGLSLGPTILGLGTGLFLWMFGWWSHRFWVVLLTTVLGGILGLYEGAAFQAHPLVAALLLALASGLLALALVRVLAFLAGGMAGLTAIQVAFPGMNQPLVCFLICGLFGLLLFRLWMMGLTSMVGSLLVGYAGLCLLDRAGSLDAAAWTEQSAVLLNWFCGIFALVGMVVQFLLDRRLRNKSEETEESEPQEDVDILDATSWFNWQKVFRKAG